MILLQLKNSIQTQVTFFTEIEIANKKSMIFLSRSFYKYLLFSLSVKNTNSSINVTNPRFGAFFN